MFSNSCLFLGVDSNSGNKRITHHFYLMASNRNPGGSSFIHKQLEEVAEQSLIYSHQID